MRTVIAEIVPIALLVAVPFSVHAGFFSSLFGLFHSDAAEVYLSNEVENPQDIRLLSATTNIDPSGVLGGGDVIVEDGALISAGTYGEDDIDTLKSFNSEISVYVVRPGDSLSQIAEMYDVTTNTILWANDLSSPTAIVPGQSLVILPIAGVRHVVKEGDTMNAIAKKYDAILEEILEFNQMTSIDELAVGQTLIIPGGAITTPVSKRVAASPTKISGGTSSTGGSSGFTHPVPGAQRTQGIHGYNAVDLAIGAGTPVRAAASGEVIVARSSGWNGGYGNYIVIRHNDGTQTLYAHLSRVDVGAGSYVGQAETIGAVGMTGRSTGAHLHFEVRGASNPF